ncbi:hypothetical protein HPULCUR_005834, partial [Helicostylum pulchrum]
YLFNSVLITLEDLNKLSLIDENNKQQKKKTGSDRLVSINGLAIMVPQAKLLIDYCKRARVYLSSPSVKSNFIFEYAKAREVKQKEEERNRRQEEEEDDEEEEEEEEKEKLFHEGKMIAYLAAGKGLTEIRDEISLATKRKREKGKEREREREEEEEGEEGEEEEGPKRRSLTPVEDINGLVNL